MTEAQAIELIAERFADVALGWPAFSGGLPFALENEVLPDADSFALMTIQHTTSIQMTIGKPAKFWRTGWIYVKLWGLTNVGSGALAALADAARSIYERQSLSLAGSEPVTIQAGLTRPVGTDGRWAMSVVQFPFYYFEQK